jgi:hypothetical protein
MQRHDREMRLVDRASILLMVYGAFRVRLESQTERASRRVSSKTEAA